jgi:hypothetical protein
MHTIKNINNSRHKFCYQIFELGMFDFKIDYTRHELCVKIYHEF